MRILMLWILMSCALLLFPACGGSSSGERENPSENTDGDIDANDGDIDTADGDADTADGDIDTNDSDIDAADGETTTDGEIDTNDSDTDTNEGDTDAADGDSDANDGDADTTDGDADLDSDSNTDDGDVDSDTTDSEEPTSEERCLAQSGSCWIGAICYGTGTENPDNACERCAGGTTWSKAGSDTSCKPNEEHAVGFCNGAGACVVTACEEGFIFSDATLEATCVAAWKKIAPGNGFTCGLLVTGGVRCWGANFHGQIGDDTTMDRSVPTAVIGLADGTVVDLSSGYFHSCALLENGGVSCWGENKEHQLSDETSEDYDATPHDITGLIGHGVMRLFAGGAHTCALLDDGGVICWGAASAGQLGIGSTKANTSFDRVSDLEADVTTMALGKDFSCALLSTGVVKCWGNDFWGQLGDGGPHSSAVTKPIFVPGLDGSGELATGIAAAATSMSCALLADGSLQCWGERPLRPARFRLGARPLRAAENSRRVRRQNGGRTLRR